MTRRSLFLTVTAILGLLAWGCGRGGEQAAEKDAQPEPEQQMVRVRVAEATETVADETLSVTGSIFAGTDVNLAAKVGGKVTFVGADEGERVADGRVLVQLDARAAVADLRRAQGGLASAQAQLDKARINQNMVEVQSDTSLRQARAELEAAQARLQQAIANERLASTRSGEGGVDIAQAESNVVAARARLAQAREQLRITSERTDTDTTSAAANVQQAVASQQSAMTALGQAENRLQLTQASTETAVQNARQAVTAAQNNLQILQTGTRTQERRQAESQVTAARAALQNAQMEYDRAKYLYDNGAIAKAQLDQAQLQLDTRREQLRQAEEQLSLAQEGPRSEEVRIAETQLAQARQQLDLALTRQRQETALAEQDVARARQALNQAESGVTQARAQLRAAQAARGQIVIAEQEVAQAEQALDQAEQAARLARAGVSQAEVARQEVRAARTAVTAADQRVRLARANLAQPRINQADIRQLVGAVRQAEAAVTAARIHVNDHTITAPIAGSVADKQVEIGEVVNPGQMLFRLVGDNLVHFNALVPEEKVRLVEVGSEVDVRVDAVPDTEFTGRVLEVLPAADLRSRTFTVKVGIPNTNGRLREGMFARGQIVLERNRRALRVPIESVVTREDQNFVVRIEGSNMATPVPIQIAGTSGGAAEIASGELMAGDRVVVEGATEIEQPQRVEILGESAEEPGAAPPAD